MKVLWKSHKQFPRYSAFYCPSLSPRYNSVFYLKSGVTILRRILLHNYRNQSPCRVAKYALSLAFLCWCRNDAYNLASLSPLASSVTPSIFNFELKRCGFPANHFLKAGLHRPFPTLSEIFYKLPKIRGIWARRLAGQAGAHAHVSQSPCARMANNIWVCD